MVPGIDLRFDKRGEWIEEELTTNAAILEREQAKHPIIKDLLNYRRMHKRWAVYVDKFKDKLVERNDQHFVHGSFRTDVVETFRLSQTNPNLMNIPRNFETDGFTKAQVKKMMALNVKNQFIPRFDGGVFMEVDEGQLEIRVAAWMSNDQKLMEAITMGIDIHVAVAAVLLGKLPSAITKDERQRCKTLNFLILYGGGAGLLGRALGVSKDQAQRYIDQYFEGFPQLKLWMDRVRERVQMDLMVETPFGFKRYFDKPHDWNSKAGFRIERQAVNTLVQSPASTIVQIAMTQAEQAIEDEGLASLMTLQVHDSAGLEVPAHEVRHTADIMRHYFEAPDLSEFGIKLPIPLIADVEVGDTWGSKTPLAK